MRSLLLAPLLLLMHSISFVQAPSWQWANTIADDGNGSGNGIASDNAHNVYVTGSFSGTFSADDKQVVGTGNTDVFVCKYNSAGKLQWIKSAGGVGNDAAGTGIAVDGSGNIYIAGYFSNTATFGTTVVNSNGSDDIFLAKYNNNGDLLWVKNAGGTYPDRAGLGSLALDSQGNIYITGFFGGHSTSPPAKETALFDTITLTSIGGSDIFVAKYDASGNVIWARSAGGVFTYFGASVAADPNGDVYVTGSFTDPWMKLGTLQIMAKGSFQDVFLAKYDGSGNVLWAESIGSDFPDYGESVVADASGNVYLTGTYYNAALKFGTFTLNSHGQDDIFIAKYSGSGGLLWAKSAGWQSFDFSKGIAIDGNQNLYITGTFNQFCIFGKDTLKDAGNQDVFVAKYNRNGDYIWSQKAGGTAKDVAYGIAADINGNVFVTGQFASPSAMFGKHEINPNIGSEMFIAKLELFPEDVKDNQLDNVVKIYPNPSQDVWNVSIEKNYPQKISATLFNVLGSKLWEQSDIDGECQIENEHLPNGVYQLNISINGDSHLYKLLK